MNELQEIIREARILRDETTSFNTKAALQDMLEKLESDDEMSLSELLECKKQVATLREEEAE